MGQGPRFVPSQPRVGLFRRSRPLLLGLVPGLVWGAAVFGVYSLASYKPVEDGFAGLVEERRFQAVAPAAGRVEQLLVRLRTQVEKGQLVGRMDGTHLAIRAKRVGHAIAELRAQMDRERAELDTAHAEQVRELDTEQRRFVRDLENARIDALTTRARIEEVRVQEAGLQFDVERQKILVAEELFSEAELIRTRTQYERLGARIAQLDKVLGSQNDRIESVHRRLSAYQNRKALPAVDMDRMLGTYAWRIAAEETELEMIALQRTRLEIRAPAAGLVSSILVPPGQFVADGRPVLKILDARPRHVVVYLPSATVVALKPGAPVEIECESAPGKPASAVIARIGSAVEEIPAQILPIRGVRAWGVPVMVRVEGDQLLRPGETVRARFGLNASGG